MPESSDRNCHRSKEAAMAEYAVQREPHFAGFWKRFLAFVIDCLVLIVILLPVMIAVYGSGYFDRAKTEFAALLSSSGDTNADLARVLDILGRPDSAVAAILDIRVQIALMVATILFWRFRGATPGKMLVKARIADAKTLGRPSTGQLTGRFFAYLVSFIPACLGFLWIAFDKRKQGWHDKLAGTVVVEEDD
jgi:uncharacterized RDD family membrane protein YckC